MNQPREKGTDLVIRRRGNAIQIVYNGERWLMPIKHILNVIKGKVIFLYPLTQEEAKKEIKRRKLLSIQERGGG